MSTVYKRYLEYPEPSHQITVRVNPPVLRWPRVTGKNITYDVRLSRDDDFSNPEMILSMDGSPWAMFNPHQKLETGTWYWQYRIEGKEWSETFSFYVDDTSIPIVSPPASDFLKAIPLEHPRVLIRASEITGIRNLSGNADIQAILRNAEEAMLQSVPDEYEDLLLRDKNYLEHLRGQLSDEQIEAYYDEQIRKRDLDASKRLGDVVQSIVIPLAQAYIITGDQKYADKAIQSAMEVAGWDPDGISSLNDFGDSRCMLSMAMVYDTFFDRLSIEQRTVLINSIKARASRFYNNWSNNIESRLLSGHVWQHIMHYLFQTGLALHGDVPEAAEWLHYIYEVFLARVPHLGGMDGGWAEGVAYFSMNMATLIDIPLSIKEYTGFDFINSHPWYNEQIDWLIYHIPPGSAADGFADNVEEINSPGINYAAFALELAKLTGNQRAAWYYREVMRYEDLDLSGSTIFNGNRINMRWLRLTKTRDLEIPEVPNHIDLQMGRVFRDIGLVSMHTNPGNTPENLMVTMRSSPFGSYGHMLSDQNVFNILYGGKKLFYRTGYKVTMQDPHRVGWYQNTRSQNGILVNGEGQPYSTEAFGWIARFLQGSELAYAKGDASNAYQSKQTNEDYGVEKNIRHLLLLKPDIVVIYDELEAREEVEWSWLIHSLEEMNIDPKNGTFNASLDISNGVGRLWSSQKVEWELEDEHEVIAINWRESRNIDGIIRTYDDDQWHLKVTNREPAKKMRFFSVIRVSPDAGLSELLQNRDHGDTIEVNVGDWVISANINATKPPGLHIRNKVSGTIFTSHAASITYDGKQIEGTYKNSSKLIELQNGVPVLIEAADKMPHAMKQRIDHYRITEP